MANNTISLRNQRLFDPGALQQSMPYIRNGLTYRSNNTSIHPRDEAGNIILQENSETNPLLIIEPVVLNINNNSVLRVIDTTFQYYKFPVASSADVPEIAAEDLQLDLSAIEFDPIFARYKPAADFVIPVTGNIYTGIVMDEVVDGVQQINTNCYTVSAAAKNSGNDLKFRFKIAHNFNGDPVGSIYFSLMKLGPNYPLNREFRTGFASEANSTVFNARLYQYIDPILIAAFNIFDIDLTTYATVEQQNRNREWNNRKNKFNIDPVATGLTSLTSEMLADINLALNTPAADIPRTSKDEAETLQATLRTALDTFVTVRNELPENSWGAIANGDTQYVYGDIVIPNFEFEIGDIFQIGVQVGQIGHAILSEYSYWAISDASKNVDVWNQEIVE